MGFRTTLVICGCQFNCLCCHAQHLKNPYVRIVFASILIILLTLLIGTQEYSGTGIPLIEEAFEGKSCSDG